MDPLNQAMNEPLDDKQRARAKARADAFDELPRVAEDEAFFAAVEGGDDSGGVLGGAHVVEFDFAGWWPVFRCGWADPGHTGGDDAAGAVARVAALQPGEEVVRVADGGGEADALQGPLGQPGEAFEDGEQVPAAVVGGECVDFVDDDGADVAEEGAVVDGGAHQHGFDGFGGGEQHVGRGAEDALPGRGGDVAVPEGGGAAEPAGVALEAGQQVVEEGFERAHVEHGDAVPLLVGHGGEQGEHSGFGFAARGGGEQDRVVAVDEGGEGFPLEGAQRGPAEGVGDVVGEGGVEQVEAGGGGHRLSSTSSADAARGVQVLRSVSVRSLARTVSW